MVAAGGVRTIGVGGVVKRVGSKVKEMSQSVMQIAVDTIDSGDVLPRTFHCVGTSGVGLVNLCVVREGVFEGTCDHGEVVVVRGT